MEANTIVQALFNPRTVAALMNPHTGWDQKAKVLFDAIGATWRILNHESPDGLPNLAEYVEQQIQTGVGQLFAEALKPGALVIEVAGIPDRWKGKKVRGILVLSE
ncbi:MAG TPA: hypothetical protein VKW06_07825 [Candidatus Angelobacter sp.]|nr:hypothetical protein [Candidatus Angelobacter sp.]